MEDSKALETRALGRTGIFLSEIGFGTCAIGGSKQTWAYGPTNDLSSLAALEEAIEQGCTFFDTADIYGKGHAEWLLSKVINASSRSKIIIASKAGYVFNNGGQVQNFSFQWLSRALDASLLRLGIEYIDIFQLHNPPAELVAHPLLEETITRLKQSGKVRFFGVSLQSHSDIADCLKAKWIDTLQLTYNCLSPEAEEGIEKAYKQGIGIIAREPLANGFLSGKYNACSTFPAGDFRSLWSTALKNDLEKRVKDIMDSLPAGFSLSRYAIDWVLENSSVSTVIVGCKTPEQVRENFCRNK